MNNFLLSDIKLWPATFLASFLIWGMVLAVFLYTLISKKNRIGLNFRILLILVITYLICETVKFFIPALRPFEVNGISPLTLTIPMDHSFPSFHAAAAFGIFTLSFLASRNLGLIMLLAASGVALGRVVANVHYVSDVLAGAVIGFLISIIVSKINFNKLHFFRRN